jgi:hypothetical protein
MHDVSYCKDVQFVRLIKKQDAMHGVSTKDQ